MSLESALVIGGCGFLGHHIVQRLVEKDVRVSVLDLDVSRNRYSGASYTRGDICSRVEVDAVLDAEKPQVIIHTASPLATDQLDLDVYMKVNVDGTRTIIEAAASHAAVRAVVYTSSAAVVFNFVSDLHDAQESLPVLRMPEQRDVYAHSKGIAEDLVRESNKPGTLLTCCLRVAGMFGERDRGLTATTIEMAKTGKTRFQVGNGKNFFDFTYVENAVDAHILAAEALVKGAAQQTPPPQSHPIAGEAFFITNGEPRSFWLFAREMGAAAGYPTPVESVWVINKSLALFVASIVEWFMWIFLRRKAKVGRYALNLSTLARTFQIDKAKASLGYQPKVSLDEGILRSGLWWQNEVEGKKDK